MDAVSRSSQSIPSMTQIHRNSQKSGVAERSEIVPDAPGHCEGHNTNAAVMISSALAIRYAMEKFKYPGTLKIFGASAEEQLLSRP